MGMLYFPSVMKSQKLLLLLLLCPVLLPARQKPGAAIPWATYEAENMRTNGQVLGPQYGPYRVETESSGQRCVQLKGKGQYVEFTVQANANALVVRYSLPDAGKGGGLKSTLGIYRNGQLVKDCHVTSRYCYLYGKYPFSNDPDSGKTRNFYDELRVRDMTVHKGDVVRIVLDCKAGDITRCIIDLADLEQVAPPLAMPANALSLADFSDGSTDYTDAMRKCIAAAVSGSKLVWLPVGTYKITGDIVVPSGVTIQGAGMWYSVLEGDENAYASVNKRVRIKGTGSNIHLADFAITGKLNYRNDSETNDGIFGTYGNGSTISRLWIAHTKVGMWIENSEGLVVEGCRLRNTIADGINFCVGMRGCVMRNCTARGGGDDCFAIWPAPFRKQEYVPGHNVIENCTGQLVFLANGAAVYGGDSNTVRNCVFTDITPGCGVLISNTFPTARKGLDNNFTGTTLVEDCELRTCGGFDHEWDWRAALEICVDKRDIPGVVIRDVVIENSLSNGINVRARNAGDKTGSLQNALLERVKVGKVGLGVGSGYGLFVNDGAHGRLEIKDCELGVIKRDADAFTLQ